MQRNENERKKMQKAFDAKFKEALMRVQALVKERGKGYRVTSVTQDYFPDGVRDALYEVNKKVLRARNLLNALPGYASDGPLEDSLLDGIAYLGFAYALHTLQRDVKPSEQLEQMQLPLS